MDRKYWCTCGFTTHNEYVWIEHGKTCIYIAILKYYKGPEQALRQAEEILNSIDCQENK